MLNLWQQSSSKALVTADELELVKQELAVLEQKFQTTFSALAELGLSDITQRLEASLPPRGRQDWTYDSEDSARRSYS